MYNIHICVWRIIYPYIWNFFQYIDTESSEFPFPSVGIVIDADATILIEHVLLTVTIIDKEGDLH